MRDARPIIYKARPIDEGFIHHTRLVVIFIMDTNASGVRCLRKARQLQNITQGFCVGFLIVEHQLVFIPAPSDRIGFDICLFPQPAERNANGFWRTTNALPIFPLVERLVEVVDIRNNLFQPQLPNQKRNGLSGTLLAN